MVEKFSDKDAKKDNFSKQMELCKRSIPKEKQFEVKLEKKLCEKGFSRF